LLWDQAIRAIAPTVKPPVTIIFRRLVRGNTGAIKRRLARSLLLPILRFQKLGKTNVQVGGRRQVVGQ
jgi:hypothetical protein